LSTPVTIFTPIFSSLARDSLSISKALAGCTLFISSAAVCTHFFCSAIRLAHTLSLTNSTELLASCSVTDMTGATS
jgi:hypothetical protein